MPIALVGLGCTLPLMMVSAIACWFVEALAVACVLILQGWFWCTPHHAPWWKDPPVLLRWLMTWHLWLCVQCWVLLHCLGVRLCRWRERSVCRLCCVLWACLSSLYCCGLLIPYHLSDKRVLCLPAWLGNWGVGGFASWYPWLVWMIGMWWRWLGKGGCCPLLCQGIRICRVPVGWLVWPWHYLEVNSRSAREVSNRACNTSLWYQYTFILNTTVLIRVIGKI